jgi:hypothetical protein
MNVYTDPSLLRLARVPEVLPELPLEEANASPRRSAAEARLAALRRPSIWAPQLLFGQPQSVKLGLDESQSSVVAGVV